MKRTTLVFSTIMLFTTMVVAACGGGSNHKSSGATATVAKTGTPLVEATPFATSKSGAALSTVDIVRKLRPSVVQVSTESSSNDVFGQAVPSQGIGTGVIIDTDGHIITNNHVVRGGGDTIASKITVKLYNGTSVPATVVGTDGQTDLAVIKITSTGLTPATLGDSASLPVGSDVVAIGYALGLEGDPTVTRGVISAKGRTIQEQSVSINDAFQTDASINPGNSGGPLVDSQGRVVGINTAIIQGSQSIGFSISIDLARRSSREIILSGQVTRGFLGIDFVDITADDARTLGLPSAEGVAIQDVVQGSPASAAGLRPDDVIVDIAGVKITNSGDLVNALRVHQAGGMVAVGYYRGGTKKSTDVTLGDRPASSQ